MTAAAPESISGEEFAAYLKLAGRAPVVPALRVTGEVELSGAVFENDIFLSGITFLGRVVLAGARFEARLSFTNCSFERGLDLASSTIEGELNLVASAPFRVAVSDNSPLAALDLRYAHVGGGLRIERARVAGSTKSIAIQAEALDVRGSVSFAGVEVQRAWTAGALRNLTGWRRARVVVDLARAKIGGDLSFSAALQEASGAEQFSIAAGAGRMGAAPLSVYRGTVRARTVTVGGQVLLGLLQIGAAPVWHHGNLRLRAPSQPKGRKPWGLDVGTPAADDFAEVWEPAEAGLFGTLDLSGARVTGGLRVMADGGWAPIAQEFWPDVMSVLQREFMVSIEGGLVLDGSTWGDDVVFAITQPAKNRGGSQLYAFFCSAVGVSATNVRFESCRFEFDGLDMSNACVAELLTIDSCMLDGGGGSLLLRGARFGGVWIGTVLLTGDMDCERLRCSGVFALAASRESPEPWKQGDALSPAWASTLRSGVRARAESALRVPRFDLQGHLAFWHATFESQTRLDRVRVAGELRFAHCKIGELRIGTMPHEDVAIGEMQIIATSIAGKLIFGRMQIGLALGGLEQFRAGQVYMTSSSVGEDFLVGLHRTVHEGRLVYIAWLKPSDFLGSTIGDSLMLDDCTIGGDIVLRRLSIGDGMGTSGALRLESTKVVGRVIACTPESDVYDAVDPRLSEHAAEYVRTLTPHHPTFTTQVGRFEMLNSSAREVRLSGLATVGSLKIVDSTIKNDLDLSEVRVGETASGEARLAGVIARDVKFVDATIAGPLSFDHCELTYNLDLRGLVVGESSVRLARTAVGDRIDFGFRAGLARPATAATLSLVDVTANDVNLSGLKLCSGPTDVKARVHAVGIKAGLFRCYEFTKDGLKGCRQRRFLGRWTCRRRGLGGLPFAAIVSRRRSRTTLHRAGSCCVTP